MSALARSPKSVAARRSRSHMRWGSESGIADLWTFRIRSAWDHPDWMAGTEQAVPWPRLR
jgi:hypothetical protein